MTNQDKQTSDPTRPNPAVQPDPTAAPPAPAPSDPGAAGKGEASPKTRTNRFNPQEKQRKDRPATRDLIDVIQNFGNMNGGQVPSVFNVNVYGDWSQNTGRTEAQSVSGVEVSEPERQAPVVIDYEIRRIRQVYQRHKAFPEALRLLKEHRAIVLKGLPQIGKRAASIALALEILSKDGPIRLLSSGGSLIDQITAIKEPPGSVFLLCDFNNLGVKPLDNETVDTLLKLLNENSSYLIFSARQDVILPSLLRTVKIEPLDLPASILVEAHLPFYGITSPVQIQEVLGQEDTARQLENPLPPHLADKLAEAISQKVHDGEPVKDAFNRLVETWKEEARNWINATAEQPEETAFRISLAIFRGVPYKWIVEAGKQLYKLLVPPPSESEEGDKTPKTAPYISPLARDSISSRLRKAGAVLKKITVQTEYSTEAEVQVVVFEMEEVKGKEAGDRFTEALLNYLWTEIFDWGEPILTWLEDIALHWGHEMSVRASGAIGALSAWDFLNIRAIFSRWANSEILTTRADQCYSALSYAFAALIWNDRYARDILGLTLSWSMDKKASRRWAAAKAFTTVGLRFPREALEQWRSMVKEDNEPFKYLDLGDDIVEIVNPFHLHVIIAIYDLFDMAAQWPTQLEFIFEPAMEGLAAWIDNDQKEKNWELGVFIFTILMSIRYSKEDHTLSYAELPPAMLFISGKQADPFYRQLLARLLAKAFGHSLFSKATQEGLHLWVEAAERDQEIEKLLFELLKEMLVMPGKNKERDKDRLWLFLTRQAENPKKPLRAAQRIMDKLNLNTNPLPLLPS